MVLHFRNSVCASDWVLPVAPVHPYFAKAPGSAFNERDARADTWADIWPWFSDGVAGAGLAAGGGDAW